MLEDHAGTSVKGYRAPSFSVGPTNAWAFDCIAEAGYRYSSSIYPIRHDHYGVPDAPRFAHEVRKGLLEVPVATVRMLNANWPAGGGGYFRLLPYNVSRWSLRRVNEIDGEPAMFYFHPWELDPEQPRVAGVGARARFRHYLNLKQMIPRLRRLLVDFRWDRVDRIFLNGQADVLGADDGVHAGCRPADRITVRAFADADTPRWNAFVERCPDATFFHSIGWRKIIEEVFRHRTHYLVAERGGAFSGILPLAEVRSRIFGHRLISLPFCVYGGPAACDAESELALIAAAEDCARSLDVQHLELRNRRPLQTGWPRQDLYVTFRKTLLPDVEGNMLAIPRKQRAMVRKGIKNELRSVIDVEPDRFFALYSDNVHRHGTPPYSRRYFEALQREFGRACEVLTVTDNVGRPLSSVLSFYFRDEVQPYYAGDDATARDLAANDFKYWELMRRACERGVRVFDYGRSKKDTGPYSFKKNWGFEPQQLHYEYCLFKRDTVPQNNPLNPKYQLFIAAWRRLPIRVANALGPHIVRNLG